MVGLPLTPSRLRTCSTLQKLPVHGCNAKSVGGKMDAGSKQERTNQVVLTPGRSPVKEVDDICFNSVCPQRHEKLLKAIAKTMHIKLTGTLREFEGCMVAKGIRTPIADEKLERIILDLSGERKGSGFGGGMRLFLGTITRATFWCARNSCVIHVLMVTSRSSEVTAEPNSRVRFRICP